MLPVVATLLPVCSRFCCQFWQLKLLAINTPFDVLTVLVYIDLSRMSGVLRASLFSSHFKTQNKNKNCFNGSAI
jgi:hypothetical protein